MDKKLIRKTTEKIAGSIEDVLPEMALEPEKRKKTVIRHIRHLLKKLAALNRKAEKRQARSAGKNKKAKNNPASKQKKTTVKE